ncbi:hypothetical protein HS088_TW03G00803 [Tripterygium wilfordii]|uniref:Uncharacterized protein n=1 Tax=Tripterygium wilfordii TaxID=458696 RepID=A0A7J7DVX4_TRIWF|nr:hypothetical protein HS088_TW03G00803 [Tripterygium wilfordii]
MNPIDDSKDAVGDDPGGPDDEVENELSPPPPAIDEGDPNYLDEEAEDRIVKGEKSDVAGLVVGDVEVEVAKVAQEKKDVGSDTKTTSYSIHYTCNSA